MAYTNTVPTPTVADVIVVTSTAELASAIATLAGDSGGTVLLDGNGGPYDISISRTGSADTPITLAALDAEKPPQVLGIAIDRSSHITITGMDVRNPDGGAGDTDVTIVSSRSITLTGNTMTGTADGFLTTAGADNQGQSGLFVRFTTDLTISDNTISNYFHGIGMLDNDGLTIADNEITAIQGDGIRGGAQVGLQITGNHMHDFLGAAQSVTHTDMIQLWGNGSARPNADILIAGNILDAANGASGQTIFILNEDFGKDGAKSADYFQNITITDNLIHNGARSGINVSDTEGLSITDNTVLWNQTCVTQSSNGSGWVNDTPWIMVKNSPDVVATGNIAPNVSINDSNIDLAEVKAQNTILSYNNTADPFYVHNHFVNLDGANSGDLRDLMLRPDSVLFGSAGAQISSSVAFDDPLNPVIGTQPMATNMLAIRLDAFAVDLAGSQVDLSTAQVVWSFDDGTYRVGAQASHEFTTPGNHEIRLHIVDADGNSASLTRMVTVQDPALLTVDFTPGTGDLSHRDSDFTVVDPEGIAVVDRDGDPAFHVTDGTRFVFSNKNAHLYNLDRFAIDFAMQPDTANQTGLVLYQHTVMKLDILADGALRFNLRTDQGSFTAVTAGGVMHDTAERTIGLRYESDAGHLQILVDGEIAGTATATGTTASPTPWGIEIGGGWGTKANYIIDDFRMWQPPSAFHVPVEAPVPGGAWGTDGNDVLFGTESSDLLVGGDGDDHFHASPGDDILLGGRGADTAHYNANFHEFDIDLEAGTVTHPDLGTDTLVNIETLRFSNGVFDMETGVFTPNAPPRAQADVAFTASGVALTLTPEQLLANDSDPNGDTIRIKDIGSGAHGTVEVDPDTGAFVYVPDAGFNGIDVIEYTIEDGFGATSTATVHIAVGEKSMGEVLDSAFADSALQRFDIDPSDASSFRTHGSGVSFHPDGVSMDGTGHISLGRLTEFESSTGLAMSIDFTRNDLDDGRVRLLWNHTNVGIELRGDNVYVHVGNTVRYTVQDAGVLNTDRQNIKLWIDQVEDKVALVVNGVEHAVDVGDAEIDWVGGGEWGWSVGGAWGHMLDGHVHELSIVELPMDSARDAYSYAQELAAQIDEAEQAALEEAAEDMSTQTALDVSITEIDGANTRLS